MIIHKSPILLYKIIILISVIIGMFYIYYSLKKEKYKYKNIYLFFIMYIIFAFIFGKLYTAIILGKINFIEAGLSSYGGLIGVLIVAIIFEKIQPSNNKIIKYTTLSLSLVYSGTKIACFFAGCCYGIPYNGIFSVIYVDGLNVPLLPIQMIEAITFILIFFVCNRFKKSKNIIYITLITTVLAKLVLDIFRYEHLSIIITPNQYVSIALLIFILIIYIYNFTKSFKN